MSEIKENKLTFAAILFGIAAAIWLVVRLKTSTIEPGSMFVFGASLLVLRLLISHYFNRLNQLPVKTR
ncbi:MAG TPA: hypothetical protein VIB79_12700 [Candidatus Binatia bacterium]